MLAVIKTGGKQYIVHPGDKIKVEKLNFSEGEDIVFNDVLLVSEEDGKESHIGTPTVSEYSVKGKILSQSKGKKLIVYKYKPKKRYHKKQGHRQMYSEVEITEIKKGK
ncbi:MAG: 50S ribosomal protein L21 [Candidatus Spechtbacteria bacterium RIFCSPHIGHO2_02_FULL_43_15b]|uniref:Large ribosomal subunit protein bL21 n=1 Tax=Candidatus Spechtbacteria bacterium RIFCSPHIGHO2_01_FULL_43_30 TaxID=1802158 RepID=A0A1G2H537_9BACT|nr:MAG: 50S ribosomal protein L21 [Candidatus Spechtbacteria bacterium RIFCSPHIGHO2_01_FULL_43_30]OGZ59836.1 MAG: 50S ribosomal protein L21 [Candidatus Spechtbacteria bacterium RIFCSPHIGHO2_02_FULL_43_15b]